MAKKRGFAEPGPKGFRTSEENSTPHGEPRGWQRMIATTNYDLLFKGLSDRIGALVDLWDTQKEAAKFAGRSPETLQNWVRGDSVPPFDVVAKMAAAKGVSLTWLATQQGPMKADQPPDGDEFVYVPRYDIRVSAGAGGTLIESEEVKSVIAFRRDWVRERLRRNPKNLIVVEIFGDSMEPTLSDGDIALVDVSEERVRGPAVYFVRAGNEAICKRIEVKLDGSLLLKSDNPRYEPWTIDSVDAVDFRVLGKIVWSGGLV